MASESVLFAGSSLATNFARQVEKLGGLCFVCGEAWKRERKFLFVSQLRISEKFLGGFASCGGKRIRFFRCASPTKKLLISRKFVLDFMR